MPQSSHKSAGRAQTSGSGLCRSAGSFLAAGAGGLSLTSFARGAYAFNCPEQIGQRLGDSSIISFRVHLFLAILRYVSCGRSGASVQLESSDGCDFSPLCY